MELFLLGCITTLLMLQVLLLSSYIGEGRRAQNNSNQTNAALLEVMKALDGLFTEIKALDENLQKRPENSCLRMN